MRTQHLLLTALLGAANTSPVEKRDSEVALACPAAIASGDIAPYAVVPVSQKNPTRAFGSTTTPTITRGDMCTWFAFTTPANLPNSICVLSFLYPDTPDLKSGSSWNISGPGNFDITALFWQSGDNDISTATTWNTQPKGPGDTARTYPNKLSPNSVTAISTGGCSRNGATSQFFARVCSNDTDFTFTQSTNSCPLGLYLLMFPKTRSTGSTSTGGRSGNGNT